jgi:hypothetical protein
MWNDWRTADILAKIWYFRHIWDLPIASLFRNAIWNLNNWLVCGFDSKISCTPQRLPCQHKNACRGLETSKFSTSSLFPRDLSFAQWQFFDTRLLPSDCRASVASHSHSNFPTVQFKKTWSRLNAVEIAFTPEKTARIKRRRSRSKIFPPPTKFCLYRKLNSIEIF